MNKLIYHKISYLVALYNKERFIVECIDSILSEENLGYDLEICIVDDGSIDNSYEVVVSQYRNEIENGKIKLFKFEKNLGKNAAYNKAFQLSDGDFICIFGADDIVVKNRTQVLLDEALLKNKSIYGGLVKYNSYLTVELDSYIPTLPTFYQISIDNYLSGGCSFLFKKHIEDIFPIPENLKFEDWWISYFLVKEKNCACINNIVTKYRIHENNDCGAIEASFTNIEKNYLRHIDYINEFISYDKKNNYLKKSMALRESFFGRNKNGKRFFFPLDSISLKILLFTFIKPKTIYDIRNYLRDLIK